MAPSKKPQNREAWLILAAEAMGPDLQDRRGGHLDLLP